MYELKICQVYLQDQSEQKPIKILEERKRGRSQGLPKFLGTPNTPGTGKATDFKFCMHFRNTMWLMQQSAYGHSRSIQVQPRFLILPPIVSTFATSY